MAKYNKSNLRLRTLLLIGTSLLPYLLYADEEITYKIQYRSFNVGKMVLSAGNDTNGIPYKAMEVKTSGLGRIFSKSSTKILCENKQTDTNDLIVITKDVIDGNFIQHDTMEYCPATGDAVWINNIDNTSITSNVGVDAIDAATFFYDLKNTPDYFNQKNTNSILEYVVLDGKKHLIEFNLGTTNTTKTVLGKLEYREISIISHSDTFFVRNRPKRIKVAKDYPMLLEMEVENNLGKAFFKLEKWTKDNTSITNVIQFNSL